MDAGRTFARLLNNIDQDGAGPRVSRLVSRYYCNSLKPTCTGKKTPGGAGMYRYITQLVSKARTFLMTHESRRFVPLFTVLEALCDRCR